MSRPNARAVCAGGLVGDAVIDLVRYEPDVALPAPCGEKRQLGSRDHRAGRVGGAGDDQPGDVAARSDGAFEQLRVRLVMRVRPDLDQHRLQPERRQDVAIGRIARRRQRHPVPRLERREKCQLERRRRSGRDDDFAGIDRDPVLLPVMPGNRLAQRRDAERVGIADAVRRQRPPRRVEHGFGRRRAGLADFEMDDRMPLCLARIGGAQHVHRDERRHQAAARGSARHRGYGPAPDAGAQPAALTTRLVEAGCRNSRSAGRIGRPHEIAAAIRAAPPSTPSAQSRQNVHSYEQIRASTESGGRSRSQHSQFGRSSSISATPCL